MRGVRSKSPVRLQCLADFRTRFNIREAIWSPASVRRFGIGVCLIRPTGERITNMKEFRWEKE